MAVCDKCGHEYLDSYLECPFCARREQKPDTEEYINRAPTRRVSPLVIALFAAVAAAIGVLVYLSVIGVITVSAWPRLTEFAQRQACFMTQANTERAAHLYTAEKGVPVTDVSALVGVALSKTPSCPAGGRYVWNPDQEHLVCSIHGWHGSPAP